jgi:hypothetical protein
MSTISAAPTKNFFVEMLVRDIELKDALLDLLDNCVDGAMRSLVAQGKPLDGMNPYDGFWARIDFSKDEFSIQDNCGGIPIDVAKNSAFRLGRADSGQIDGGVPTVGVYGIGMKRAIFKMGQNSVVASRHHDEAFDVEITKEWMADDHNWDLELKERSPLPSEDQGTHIIVNEIRPGISSEFATSTFYDTFCEAVSQYYGIIIQKGFKVTVGSVDIEPRKIGFLLDEKGLEHGGAIAPYVYQKDPGEDGVEVTLAVGFYRPLPSEEEEAVQEEEEREGRPSSEMAGWTIVANDRVVLYADKTRVTGWDDAGVPAYHTQFTAISGVVIFRSNKSESLPLTTTKRGVNGNSDLYLEVKNHMRDGLKLFTSFTNQWKKAPEERDKLKSDAPTMSASEVVAAVSARMKKSRREEGVSIFVPDLPKPNGKSTDRWIRYRKPLAEIQKVSKFYFDAVDTEPSVVGERCFSKVLEQLNGAGEEK